MEKHQHKSSNTIDQLIAAHLKKQQAEQAVSPQFSSRLMGKLAELKKEEVTATEPFIVSSRSLFIPIFLLCVVILGAFGYYMVGTSLSLNQEINLSFDFFQQKGFKYAFYGLIALLGFSLLDHFFQLRSQQFSK